MYIKAVLRGVLHPEAHINGIQKKNAVGHVQPEMNSHAGVSQRERG
jgi:hypothetical protein